MTDKKISDYMAQEAIRPGKLGSEELSLEREIMRQMRMLGIPKQRPVIVKKKYTFMCPQCGAVCMKISENDLKKYQRVWKLLKMVPLSDAQIDEYVALCESGYRYIGVYCPNEECNSEFEWIITNEEEWAEHLEHVEIGYEIVENTKTKENDR